MIRRWLTLFGVATSHPAAFLGVLAFAAIWWWFDPDTLDWHGAATLATLSMTLFIQRAEHRDTQAIHAKLDELLKAQAGARTSLSKIDDEEPEDIERYRARERPE